MDPADIAMNPRVDEINPNNPSGIAKDTADNVTVLKNLVAAVMDANNPEGTESEIQHCGLWQVITYSVKRIGHCYFVCLSG